MIQNIASDPGLGGSRAICSVYVHTAAADADHLVLHPPLLVWLTAYKPQHSQGAKDWFALAFTLSVIPGVIHLFSLAHHMGNVWREPACIVVTLVLQAAHSRHGESWCDGRLVLKALCVVALFVCIQHSPGGVGPVLIGQVDREGHTAVPHCGHCKLIDVYCVVGSHSGAVGRACTDLRLCCWGCLDGGGGCKGHEEEGSWQGVLHSAGKVAGL